MQWSVGLCSAALVCQTLPIVSACLSNAVFPTWSLSTRSRCCGSHDVPCLCLALIRAISFCPTSFKDSAFVNFLRGSLSWLQLLANLSLGTADSSLTLVTTC